MGFAGEGEALTSVVAIHCGDTVVTDDRKAARVVASRSVTLRTTLDLVKTWVEHQAMTTQMLHTVLTDLRERGNYYPPRSHPLKCWWDTAMELA